MNQNNSDCHGCVEYYTCRFNHDILSCENELSVQQCTIEGDTITLDEFEDSKASIQHKLRDNEIFWRRLHGKS